MAASVFVDIKVNNKPNAQFQWVPKYNDSTLRARDSPLLRIRTRNSELGTRNSLLHSFPRKAATALHQAYVNRCYITCKGCWERDYFGRPTVLFLSNFVILFAVV